MNVIDDREGRSTEQDQGVGMKEGWQTKTLGDVCHVYQPETISQKQMAGSEFPVYGANGQIGWHNQFNHDESQLILGCRGSCGSVHFTKPRAWINGNAMVVQAKPEFIDSFYLAYALKGGIELADAITGTAQPQITRTSLMPLAITLPESLPEQQRIVALLDEAFAGHATATANAERNLQNARAIFESHLEAVFSERGEGWVETTLEEATGGIFTGPFGSLLHKSDYVSNGIPLVNPAHITGHGIQPDPQKTVSVETALRLRSYIMSHGDIVIGRRGEMGRCAVVTEREDGWLCGTGSFFIKPSSRCEPRYLARYLRSKTCKSMLEEIAGGAVMPNLSNSELGNLSIHLPPLDKQLEILEQVDCIHTETQHLTRLYERKLAALEELKKSLLRQAFNGEL